MKTLQTVPLLPKEETSAENKLWFAVIVQALLDAEYLGNKRERIYTKMSAIDWLKSDSKDFRLVFHYAGYEEYRISGSDGEGIDVVTGNMVKMIDNGIIDPLLVTKSALQNAASVATTILSTDCVINNIRVDESSR